MLSGIATVPFDASELPWLPRPPDDFRVLCRDLRPDAPQIGQRLHQLSSHALSPAQASLLGRTLVRIRDGGADPWPLSPFRLGVLSPWTADFLVDALPAAALRHGVALEVVPGAYGQIEQEALNPASTLNTAGLDAILLLADQRSLGLDRPADAADAPARVEEAVERLRRIANAIQDASGATLIVATAPVVADPLFGGFDRRTVGSPRAMTDRFNAAVVDLADEVGAYLLDLAALAERVGTDRWFDPVHWHHYKTPFAAELVPLIADTIGRLLGAIRGRARKCLVLDLDNTLWGGVVGDDGVDALAIGQGSAVGEAFLAVQRMALDLRDRGVILAVSSKNNDTVAREPFRSHPDMLLRESDIAVFQANWTDKASNLEAIARALNIGLDALVMLDDNPAERAQLRAALPMVAVPELPSDPSWYPRYLAAAGYFEAVAYSEEDRTRARSYAADSRRAEVAATSRNLGDYLSSLEMVAGFGPFDRAGRPRIAQLINKSNQFNLTTRRYSEAEVAELEAGAAAFTMQVRLRDRFGDMGMVGAIIVRQTKPHVWDIDTWLMSCRVLGRRLEEAMRDALIAAARQAGVARLTASYRPTPKNGMVATHYDRLGFTLQDESEAGKRYGLLLADFTASPLPFAVERLGDPQRPPSTGGQVTQRSDTASSAMEGPQ